MAGSVGPGNRIDEGEPTRFTREEADRDRVGWCVCGLSGRQRHVKVTPAGARPVLYERGDFTCRGTWPGRHRRTD